MRELRVAAAEVGRGTDGRVQVKFYPGGVMGNDAVVLRKIRLGQLQGGVLTASELSLVYPDAPAYSLPFLFEDWDEVRHARAAVDPLLAKGFQERGLRMLGVSGVGFAYLMGDQPLRSRADVASIKLWVPQNDVIAIRTFEAAGISPIPLPIGDVFTSLQTGMVDTVANTPSGAIALQWHGKLRHMVDLPLSFVVGYLVLDEKAWKRLSAADQQVVAKAFGDAAARMDATVKSDNLAALEALKKQGLSVNSLSPEESARWRTAGDQVIADMEAKGELSAEVMSALRQSLSRAGGD
jgi:TRAP-type C4-dicarboxylate transport system substrate-binding protein